MHQSDTAGIFSLIAASGVSRHWIKHYEKKRNRWRLLENSFQTYWAEHVFWRRRVWSTASSLIVPHSKKYFLSVSLTPRHHPNTLVSDKTSRRCFKCLLETVWSLLDWLMNLAEAPASSAKQHRVSTIQPWHLFLNQEGPSLLHPAPFFSYLFIITFSRSCFSPGRAACF